MADDMKKDQGQHSGQPGDQSQQRRDPQDVTKKNPGQDREQNNEGNQKEQDEQRRAS
jgi:hypothetical protein